MSDLIVLVERRDPVASAREAKAARGREIDVDVLATTGTLDDHHQPARSPVVTVDTEVFHATRGQADSSRS
jgi:hypothetical protein